MMSTEDRLIVDVETLQVRPLGPAIAGIWLATESCAFPAAGWSDFVVVILSWWAGALVSITRGNGKRMRIPFMDGPYAVDVARSSAMLHFTFISRDREIGTGEAPLNSFVLAFTSQACSILHACRAQGWWSADAGLLESALSDLNQANGRGSLLEFPLRTGSD